MKKDKLYEYILVIFFCVLTFFDFIVLNKIPSRIVMAIFLPVYTIICSFFVKTKRVDNRYKKMVTFFMILFAIIYLIAIYIMGIFAGFYRNPIVFGFKTLYNRVIPYVIIIVFSELLRKKFVLRNNKISTIFITIALVLVDVAVYNTLNGLNSLEDYLTFVGYICMSSVSVNLLCNYIVRRYDCLGNIFYRIITTIYMYTFPILPDIYLFFQSSLKILYPYIIYLFLDNTFEERMNRANIKSQNVYTFFSSICIVILGFFVALVSCKFKYGIISIGSSSMSGAINKGDAVVFEQYKDQTLEEGQVIIFNQDGIRVVHRIVDVQYLSDNEIYYTKGDANQQEDDGYRKAEDIVGIVKFKVNDIGWPVIWLNDVFRN